MKFSDEGVYIIEPSFFGQVDNSYQLVYEIGEVSYKVGDNGAEAVATLAIWKKGDDVRVVVSAAGKTAEEWLAALKGIDYQNLRDHIFNGDLRKVTGCHYRSAVDGVNIRFVNNAPPNGNSLGVLEGAIEMRKPLLDAQGNITGYKWVVKNTQGELQTFFPSTWSQDKILEECASALSNPNKALVPGKTRMYTAESNSGVFIKWFEDTNGIVTSIFPEFN